MYLKKSTNSRTGRTYLSCVYGYRDANGRSRTKTYRSFGYLDELEEHYDDPVAYFTDVVAKLNRQTSVRDEIENDLEDRRKPRAERNVVVKNLGYVFAYAFYEKLRIEAFWKNVQQKEGLLFDLNSVFRLLTMLRILEPTQNTTKRYHRERLFERSDFSDDEFTRAVPVISKYKDRFYAYLQRHLRDFYQPDLSLGYNLVNTMFLSIQGHPLLEYRRLEQKKRPELYYQSSCVTDRYGIPLDAHHIPASELSVADQRVHIASMREKSELERIVTVEDLLIDDLSNLVRINLDQTGFIVSQNVLDSKGEYRSWILNDDWTDEFQGERFKSRRINQTFRALDADGRTHKTVQPIKQVCVWSKDFYERQRKRAQEEVRVEYESDRRAANTAGEPGSPSSIDSKLIIDRELVSGYQVFATTEVGMRSRSIAGAFRRLIRFQKLLSCTKSFLVEPPIDFPREDYVNLHTMVCLASVMILSLILKDIGHQERAYQLSRELAAFNCVNIKENLYFLTYWSDTIEQLCHLYGLDFSKDIMTLSELRHQIAKIKNN